MKSVDTVLKFLTPLLAILGFVWGVYQYKMSKENEYRNNLYSKQYEIYSELLNITSDIAITEHEFTQTPDFKEAVKKFSHLYYGRMHLIQNEEVIRTMETFYRSMRNYADVNNSIGVDSPQNLSIRLANACKTSLQTTQGIFLPDQKPFE